MQYDSVYGKTLSILCILSNPLIYRGNTSDRSPDSLFNGVRKQFQGLINKETL